MNEVKILRKANNIKMERCRIAAARGDRCVEWDFFFKIYQPKDNHVQNMKLILLIC
jgi:hypothetical protein